MCIKIFKCSKDQKREWVSQKSLSEQDRLRRRTGRQFKRERHKGGVKKQKQKKT